MTPEARDLLDAVYAEMMSPHGPGAPVQAMVDMGMATDLEGAKAIAVSQHRMIRELRDRIEFLELKNQGLEEFARRRFDPKILGPSPN